eukprot:scaffold271021_cov30-Tisochrysis_lutea.AAC.1
MCAAITSCQGRWGTCPAVSPLAPLRLEPPSRLVLFDIVLLPARESGAKLGRRQPLALRKGLRSGLVSDE